MMEGDLTWDGEHTIQYTGDVLWNSIPETYIILLTNVTPINSINELSLPLLSRNICLMESTQASVKPQRVNAFIHL